MRLKLLFSGFLSAFIDLNAGCLLDIRGDNAEVIGRSVHTQKLLETACKKIEIHSPQRINFSHVLTESRSLCLPKEKVVELSRYSKKSGTQEDSGTLREVQ